MAWLAAAMPYVQAAGTAMAAGSTIAAGIQSDRNAKFQAHQLNEKAKEEQAIAQRQSIAEREKAKLVQSRIRTVSAASGAGTQDPTVHNLLADVEAEGEVHALTALYNGGSKARYYEGSADAAFAEGKSARRAGFMRGGSTLLDGAATLHQRYG